MSVESTTPSAVVAKRPDRTPLSRRNPIELAQHFVASGYFKDATDISKAVVKIVAGEELGLGPMASMRGIYIIEGAPSYSAGVLGALIKRSDHYNYKTRESTAEKAVIEFFEDGDSLGLVEFTIEEARGIQTKERGQWMSLADTLRWKNSPTDMLFARCLTRGQRQHCPDVTSGNPAYTPEELGAEVDEHGEPMFVEAESVDVTEPEAQPSVPRLPDDTLGRLMQGYEIASPELGGHSKLDGLNILLGSLGFDGIDSEPGLDLRAVMSTWSSEQAERVIAGFAEAIDKADEAGLEAEAEEVDGEVVRDGEEATDALA